jgi:hypothetical protein
MSILATFDLFPLPLFDDGRIAIELLSKNIGKPGLNVKGR